MMNEKEVEKLLSKANQQRLFGEYEQALAYLHQLNTAFPEEIKYLGLLASTYYGAGEKDIALEYCDKIFEIDPQNKEAFELKGMIAYDDGDKEGAEDFFKTALTVDAEFVLCRVRLMELYFEEKKYEEVVSECNFMLENTDQNRNQYNTKEKKEIKFDWLYITYVRLWESLIELGQYETAIKIIEEYKEFSTYTIISDPYFLFEQDDMLFKLYYKTGNKEKTQEFTDLWRNHYKVVESYIEGMKKDAEQDYIYTINLKNYNIDENGNFC